MDPLIQGLWKFDYWSVFCLTWFTIPFIQEYMAAYDFTSRERFMRSLRNNIPQLIIMLVLFVVIIIVLAVTESGREALQR